MNGRMKRCLVPMTLSGSWGQEHVWPGLEVNFDRELKPGFTVADAVAGREDCFEDVDALKTTDVKARALRTRTAAPAAEE